MNRWYRVNEFAELAGVTAKTLYHYDRLGLLTPQRSDAGHRLYRATDLERLEQIVALKFLGLPLKQIKVLVERGLPLRDALRAQRTALHEQRRRLDRAIAAIEEAERNLAPGEGSNAGVIKTLIEAIGMQDDVELMKQYYSEDAWAKWKQHYEQWPSPAWQALFREVEAALDEDPASPHVQALAARWLELMKQDTGNDPAIRTGMGKAWVDRDRWPASLKERRAAFNVDRLTAFISEAVWIGQDADRRRRGLPPERAAESRTAVYRDVAAALHEDPAGRRGQDLLARWHAVLDAETGDDAATKAEMLESIARRRTWPDGMRRWAASLHAMDVETWERVVDFIEKAGAGSPDG